MLGVNFLTRSAGIIAATTFCNQSFSYFIFSVFLESQPHALCQHFLCFLSCIKQLKKIHSNYIQLVGILYGIALQLHYIEVFVGPMMGYIFLQGIFIDVCKRRKLRGRSLFICLQDYCFILLGFSIGWSPFLAFEARHGFNNLHAIFSICFSCKYILVKESDLRIFCQLLEMFSVRLFARLILNIPDTGL